MVGLAVIVECVGVVRCVSYLGFRGQISLQKQETQKLYKQIEALQGRLLAVERELGDV